MTDRKTYEVVEIDGRTFVIHLMPAAYSVAILKELLTRAMPIDLLSIFDIGGINVGKTVGDLGAKNAMSVEEFVEFQNKLLMYVQERLAGAEQDVVDREGNYLVQDLEFNIDLYTQLLLKVVSVNYKDFFIAKLKKLSQLLNLKEEQEQEAQIAALVQSLAV